MDVLFNKIWPFSSLNAKNFLGGKMTVRKDMEMMCPGCQSRVSLEYYQSVTLSENPELLDPILDFKLNTTQCPNCSQKVFVDDFFILNDAANKLFVLKYPLADLDKWEHVLKQSDVYWDNLPEELRNTQVNLRLVFGPFALKEKVLLARDDLNDSVVEIYKIGLFGQFGEEFFNKKHRLYYYEQDDDYLQFVLVNLELSTEISMVKVPIETFSGFEKNDFPDISKKELTRHLLKKPFVSMEKMYFSKITENQVVH